jgi:hypothetical protein
MSPGPACWRSCSAEQGRWAMDRAATRVLRARRISASRSVEAVWPRLHEVVHYNFWLCLL